MGHVASQLGEWLAGAWCLTMVAVLADVESKANRSCPASYLEAARQGDKTKVGRLHLSTPTCSTLPFPLPNRLLRGCHLRESGTVSQRMLESPSLLQWLDYLPPKTTMVTCKIPPQIYLAIRLPAAPIDRLAAAAGVLCDRV